MLKKILLGTAIAVVFSTASYAQNASPPDFFQDWFTDAQTTFNQAMNEPCFNWAVSNALNKLQNDQSQMTGWIDLANNTLLPPVGQSNIKVSQASLNAVRAELPAAKSENSQVANMIWTLAKKPPCVTDQQLRTSALTPEQADQALRLLLGVPSSDTERTARDLDKTLKDDPKAGNDLLNGDGKQSESKSTHDQPQTPAKTEAKTDTKTETKVDAKTDTKVEQKSDARTDAKADAEHSQRTVTPEKTEAVKQVARTNPVEARQAVSHIAQAHVNSIGNVGAMHTNGFSAMHMGNLGGMHMGGMSGLGGMHMGGMSGMHFGRM